MGTKLALVTGGNGFVGCHVVRALLARGDRVRVLAREKADLSALAGLPVEIVRGDLRYFDSIERAVSECNEVYHVGADYRLWLTDPAPMYATNVDGTEHVIRAATGAGVPRIVYTSTVGALGIPHGGVGREDTPSSLATMPGHYKRSKFMAEQAALEAARAGAPVVIVNPSTPIGALDFKPTPTGRIIVDFLNRRMPAYVETGLNIVGVEDVARGHLLAAERGRVGEKYILGGENLTLKEFLGRLAAISGMPAPKVRIPYAVAFSFALGAEAFSRTVTHRAPRASLTEVRMARKHMFFDSSKARAELGYSPGPIDVAITAAIEFFRNKGAAKSAA
ncbi:hopanoid-associated sugar epimerase [Candidatus Binatus sp.]|uniref:hopanoid-associated sugar epimerase n=1 Tax=Candidatus Binatus sp. TaxID=2811406 RepID=UPI003BB07F7E